MNDSELIKQIASDVSHVKEVLITIDNTIFGTRGQGGIIRDQDKIKEGQDKLREGQDRIEKRLVNHEKIAAWGSGVLGTVVFFKNEIANLFK